MTTLGKIAVASRPMSEAAHSTEGLSANGQAAPIQPSSLGESAQDVWKKFWP